MVARDGLEQREDALPLKTKQPVKPTPIHGAGLGWLCRRGGSGCQPRAVPVPDPTAPAQAERSRARQRAVSVPSVCLLVELLLCTSHSPCSVSVR